MNPESTASKISPERLKKYADFVEVHSDLQPNGTLVYNPEKALVGLLSILTPDPKGIVLAGMEDGVIYSSERYLLNNTLSFIRSFGISDGVFPIKNPWTYCELRDKGLKTEGSLVKVGAVVREVRSHEDLGTFGYMRSEAGRDLGIPLSFQGIEFVNKARESGVPHKYDSMWRLLGNVGSPNDQRRPWAVYNIVEYLVNNPGFHEYKDIYEGLKGGNIYDTVIGKTLRSLGATGIINYSGQAKDRMGKRPKGWAKYNLSNRNRLQDFDNLCLDIRFKMGRRRTAPDYLRKITQYIEENPNLDFSCYDIGARFPEIRLEEITRILSALSRIAVIKKAENRFASANNLSKMFYDLVLVPAKEEALTLGHIKVKMPSRSQISMFLQNYQEERSHIGPQVGEEVKEKIVLILKGGEMKLSQITQEHNREAERELSTQGIKHYLNTLISKDFVEKTRAGFYRLKADSESTDSSLIARNDSGIDPETLRLRSGRASSG